MLIRSADTLLQLCFAASLTIMACFDWPIFHTAGTKTCQAPISHAAWLWSCSLVLSSKRVSLGCLCTSKLMNLSCCLCPASPCLVTTSCHASLLSTKRTYAPNCHNTRCMSSYVCLLPYSLQHVSHDHRALYSPQNLSTRRGLCMHSAVEHIYTTQKFLHGLYLAFHSTCAMLTWDCHPL